MIGMRGGVTTDTNEAMTEVEDTTEGGDMIEGMTAGMHTQPHMVAQRTMDSAPLLLLKWAMAPKPQLMWWERCPTGTVVLVVLLLVVMARLVLVVMAAMAPTPHDFLHTDGKDLD